MKRLIALALALTALSGAAVAETSLIKPEPRNIAAAVTREQFCAAVAALLPESAVADETLPFADTQNIVPDSYAGISALYNAGILQGVPKDGTLFVYPERMISRQDAFTMIGRLLGASTEELVPFTDSDDIAAYAFDAVARLYELGIIENNGALEPAERLSLAEMTVLIDAVTAYLRRDTAKLETVAGKGARGWADGVSLDARFTMPYSVLPLDDGSMYIFDTYNNMIRLYDGIEVTTVAGREVALDDTRLPIGYYLDGALAEALMDEPAGGVIDKDGRLYIADSANNAIRLISGGSMYTFSGGEPGFADGSRTEARFNYPTAVAIDDGGVLYVTDTLNNSIRVIAQDGSTVTLAGFSGELGFADGPVEDALFREPSGIALGDDGAVYIADTGNHRIRKIKDGFVTTVAGTSIENDEDGDPLGGFADGTEAMFRAPADLVFADGLLIVADSANNRIRAIDLESGRVSTVCGNGEPGDMNGPALGAMLSSPAGLAFSVDTLYIADTHNNKIKAMRFDAALYR